MAAFVDAHCHLFNIDDVPVYATIDRQLDDVAPGSLLGIGAALLLASILPKLGRDEARAHLAEIRPFIAFFENSRAANITAMTDTIGNQVADAGDEIVLTPLVMDFYRVPESGELVEDQACALADAIRKCNEHLAAARCRVLPFVGLDLRRFRGAAPGSVRAALDQFLGFMGGMAKLWKPASGQTPTSGQFIGVKLYPPMGFAPDSEPAFHEFFKVCESEGFRITAHCQRGSYEAPGQSQSAIGAHTDPVHWERILERTPNLSLNLAHFGGSEDLARTFLDIDGDYDPDADYDVLADPNTGTWTWRIIELVSKYDHVFADLSAFDWQSKAAVLALRALLIREEANRLPVETPRNLVRDKLLWGSDFPMTIGRCGGKYEVLVKRFRDAINAKPAVDRVKEAVADDVAAPDQKELYVRMTDANPRAYLFG